MYECINGWTKKSMLEHVRKEFKGKSIAYGSANRCMYRGNNGAKCAVGMFISDDLYSRNMDGNMGTIREVLKHYPNLKDKMPLELDGLIDFQHIHDVSQTETCLYQIINWIETNVKENT